MKLGREIPTGSKGAKTTIKISLQSGSDATLILATAIDLGRHPGEDFGNIAHQGPWDC